MGDRRHFNRNLDQDGPLFPRSNLEQNLDQYFSSNRQQQQSNAFSHPPMNGFNNRPGPFRNNVQMPGGGGSDNPNSSFGINNNRDNNTDYKQQTFVSGKGEHWNYFGSENNNSNDNYPRKNNNNVFERLDTAKSMNSNMIERNNFDDDFRRDEEGYGNNSNWRNFNSNVNNNLGRNNDNVPQNWNSNNDLRNNSKVGRGGDDGWRKNNPNFGLDNSKCEINNVPFKRDFNDGGSDINNTNNRQNFGPGNVDELRNNSKSGRGGDGWSNNNRNIGLDNTKWCKNFPFEKEFKNGGRGNVDDLRNNSKGGNGWSNNNRNVGPNSSKWGNNNRPFEKELNSGGRDIYSSNNEPNFDPAARDAENFNRWKNNTNFGPNNPKDFKKDNNNFEGGNNNWNTFGPRNSIDFQTFKNFGNVANTNSWDCERGINRPFPNDFESRPPRNANNTFPSNNFAVDITRNLENQNNRPHKSFSINNMNFDDRRFNGPDDFFTPDNNTSWNKTPDNYNRRSNEETFATNIPVRSNNNFEINSRNDDFRVDPRQLEDQRFGRNELMFSPRKQMLDEVRKRHLDNRYGNPNAMSHNKSHNMQRNYPVASGRQNNANDLDEEELLRKRRRRNSNDDGFQSNNQKAKFPAKRDTSYNRHSHEAPNSFEFEHHDTLSDHHDYDDNDDAYNYGDDINDCGSEATVYTGQLILKPYPAGPTKRNPKAYWRNWWPKYVYIENSIEQVDKNDEYVKHKLKFQPLTDDDIHKEAGDFINAAMKYFSTATRRLTEQNFRNRDLRTILKMRGTVYNILFNVALTKKEQARCHFLLLLMNHKVKLAFIYQDIIEFWHRCKETVRRFENAEISLSDEVTQAYVVLNDRLYIHFLYESIIQLKVICVSEYPSFLKFYKGLQMKLAKTKTTTT